MRFSAGSIRAPQEDRTFFVTTSCWQRRSLFRVDRNCELMIDVLRQNRAKSRFRLHEFVLMPDHLHAIITPAYEIPLERAVQFIKGGFSYRIKKELGFNGEIWQAGFTEHRIKDPFDYQHHREYIHRNPMHAGLKETYRWISRFGLIELDPCPPGLKPFHAVAGYSPA